nr:MAG TPA: hypothetical protein [Bacteriophage sp.]
MALFFCVNNRTKSDINKGWGNGPRKRLMIMQKEVL